jgi:hypothetical protein
MAGYSGHLHFLTANSQREIDISAISTTAAASPATFWVRSESGPEIL